MKCNRLGCLSEAITKGLCEEHSSTIKVAPRDKPKYHDNYDRVQWKRLRKTVLSKQPLCLSCSKYGVVVASEDVDHIIPHRGDQLLFSSLSNLQALCHSCHSRKTNKERKGKLVDFVNDVTLVVEDGRIVRTLEGKRLNSLPLHPLIEHVNRLIP